jgi:hypothetical protein
MLAEVLPSIESCRPVLDPPPSGGTVPKNDRVMERRKSEAVFVTESLKRMSEKSGAEATKRAAIYLFQAARRAGGCVGWLERRKIVDQNRRLRVVVS